MSENNPENPSSLLTIIDGIKQKEAPPTVTPVKAVQLFKTYRCAKHMVPEALKLIRKREQEERTRLKALTNWKNLTEE